MATVTGRKHEKEHNLVESVTEANINTSKTNNNQQGQGAILKNKGKPAIEKHPNPGNPEYSGRNHETVITIIHTRYTPTRITIIDNKANIQAYRKGTIPTQTDSMTTTTDRITDKTTPANGKEGTTPLRK